MTLTERQKKELNVAIWEYLLAEGGTFARTVEAFKDEAQLGAGEVPDLSRCLLEKKWTSVVRLQKQVLDLQAKLEAASALGGAAGRPGAGLDAGSSGSSAGGGSSDRLLPRGPAKATLAGHRAPVTAVAVHPRYSLVASASEDTTVKVWDYETAQYERTLKGHTGAVTAVAFDLTGAWLATASADMSAKLWDLSTYACVKTLKGHDHTLSAVQFTPAGDQVQPPHMTPCTPHTPHPTHAPSKPPHPLLRRMHAPGVDVFAGPNGQVLGGVHGVLRQDPHGPHGLGQVPRRERGRGAAGQRRARPRDHRVAPRHRAGIKVF
jgi:WD domain, G-beta repeat